MARNFTTFIAARKDLVTSQFSHVIQHFSLNNVMFFSRYDARDMPLEYGLSGRCRVSVVAETAINFR